MNRKKEIEEYLNTIQDTEIYKETLNENVDEHFFGFYDTVKSTMEKCVDYARDLEKKEKGKGVLVIKDLLDENHYSYNKVIEAVENYDKPYNVRVFKRDK